MIAVSGGRRRLGPGAPLGEAPRVLHYLFDLCFDCLEEGLVGEAILQERVPQSLDGAARLPLLDFFAGAVGEGAHALGGGAGGVGLAPQQGRATTAAGTAPGRTGRLAAGPPG